MTGLPEDPRRHIVRSDADLEQWERRIIAASKLGRISWDMETSGLRWYMRKHPPAVQQHLLRNEGVQAIGHVFGFEEDGHTVGVYMPIRHEGLLAVQCTPEKVTQVVQSILGQETAQVVTHNGKFDLHMAANDGIEVKAFIHDTMVMANLLDENVLKNLEFCCVRYGVDPDAYVASQAVKRAVKEINKRFKWNVRKSKKYGVSRMMPGYAMVDIDLLGYYGAGDGIHTLELFHKLLPWIESGWWGIYGTECALIRVLQKAERVGLPINAPYLEARYDEAVEAADELQEKLFDLAGQNFSPSSEDELGEIIYGQFRLPVLSKSKTTEKPGLGAVALVELWHSTQDVAAREFIATVLDWRGQDKIRSTYTRSIIALCDDAGVLHCDFKAQEASTGRMSSEKPNFQNFPSGPLIRTAFEVPVGKVRLFLDYSQVELRILAYYSGDPRMTQAFIDGEDIHSMTSREMFGTDAKEVRRRAKVINFGLAYGMTPLGFVGNMNKELGTEPVTLEQTEGFFERFHRRFTIQDFCERLYGSMRQHRPAAFTSIFGRTRRLPDVAAFGEGERWKRQRAERQAISSAIQGTAADLIKNAMIRMPPILECYDADLVNVVHDEVQVDVPREAAYQCAVELKAVMEDYPVFAPIPIVVEGEWSATHWADKSEIPWMATAA